MNRLFLARLLAAAAASCLAQPSFAATPASGSLDPDNTHLSYGSGPFAQPNASVQQTPDAPACDMASNPCDDFTLTVTLPDGFLAAHPFARIVVNSKWPVNNDAMYVYAVDPLNQVRNESITGNDPNGLSLPATTSTWIIRIAPSNTSADLLTTTIDLVADPVKVAGGTPPRFTPMPSGFNNTGGEMNIGYNPQSAKAMTLGYLNVLRTTFPENLEPAQPECCDGQWDNVTDPISGQNTNDPILFTDQLTHRTFTAQLQAGTPGESIFEYTDDDGAMWTQSPSTVDGGADHQTVGGGPYPADNDFHSGSYPDALYFCSQSVGAAFCVRSDDGGMTFGAPVQTLTAADCDGFVGAIHGHIKVAPDGTAYVPNRNCGGQPAMMVSSDAGQSWTVRRLPNATSGEGDPSLAIASDGTGYLCYLSSDAHAHVAVTHDHGQTYANDSDIGVAAGVARAVFTEAVAGDPDRAACAFLGTPTEGNFQSVNFDGVWYPYIAMTYDGGQTWHTVNATPDDPVQGTGGIALGGTTAVVNRNLLDFNEITRDELGRVLFGFDDGCIGDCVTTGAPGQICIPTFAGPDECLNSDAWTVILRQTGGRTLLAANDPVEPGVPKNACLSGGRDSSTARLLWKKPDHRGAAITGYRIYRGTAAGAETLLAEIPFARSYDDTTVDSGVASYFYKVTALNAQGEGPFSNEIELTVGSLPAAPPANVPPTASLAASPSSGELPLNVTLDASASHDDDSVDGNPVSDRIVSYTFDFGDGSPQQTQSNPTLQHTYGTAGDYVATVKAVDSHGATSTNTGAAGIHVSSPPPPPNTAPVAALTATPHSGTAPLSVGFDASGSSDADSGDSVALYRFDFGDGSAVVQQAGPTVTHVYSAAGSYTASLVVVDTHGANSASPSTVGVVVSAPATGGSSSGSSAGSGSGGGALEFATLLGLLSAAAARRRRR